MSSGTTLLASSIDRGELAHPYFTRRVGLAGASVLIVSRNSSIDTQTAEAGVQCRTLLEESGRQVEAERQDGTPACSFSFSRLS